MGMSSTPAAPPAPDPVATAAAQSQMNRDTAVTQTGLNAINQYTPDGSLEYSQNGEWADGTPRFNATTSLNGPQQDIFNTNLTTQQNVANIGRDQSARIGALLGTPLKLGNEESEARLMELGSARLTPKFAADEEALRTRLANSGIRAGSAAFDAEMGRLGETKNDAINQLLLTGRQQANTEIMAERNAPINEIGALMSASQVAPPNFTNTPQSQVAGVDYSGLVQNNYNAAVKQQQMENDTNNAMMGGMFSLAGTLGTAGIKYSDRRLKRDIHQIGNAPNGLPFYTFAYIWDDENAEPRYGLMSDDVRAVMPGAVIIDAMTGFDMVDYSRALGA